MALWYSIKPHGGPYYNFKLSVADSSFSVFFELEIEIGYVI